MCDFGLLANDCFYFESVYFDKLICAGSSELTDSLKMLLGIISFNFFSSSMRQVLSCYPHVVEPSEGELS